MDEPLDDAYLKWLYNQVGPKTTDPSKTYWSLFRQLFSKEFVWIVPNDDNRVADGRDLRYEFLEQRDSSMEHTIWLGLGCSVLEMLIGLCRRLSFEAESTPKKWFWILIRNLGLDSYTDASSYSADEVDEILERLIWRTYRFDGVGGLFPLENPVTDQTKIEIWYQMSMYLLERE